MIPKEKLDRARELSEHFDRPECRQELMELIHSCLIKYKKADEDETNTETESETLPALQKADDDC